MESMIQFSVSTADTSNSAASPVLRTDVNLSDDDLSQEAKAQFGYHREILHAFQLNTRNVLANDRLTPIGRHIFCTTLEQDYMNCKRVLNYVATQMELKTTALPMPPIFVMCGLPRTGSTLLFNLLACDPACRAPLVTDMLYPVPPLARSDIAGQAQRIIKARASSEMLKTIGLADYERQLLAGHARYAYEEDQYIFFQAGVKFLHMLLAPRDNTELLEWFFHDTNKNFAYEYHKTFLQMLNDVDAPRSHWLLKAPLHAFFLDTLLHHYPSVSLIMTHRRLDEVIPSFARHCIVRTSPYLDSNNAIVTTDRLTVLERIFHSFDVRIPRLVKVRRAHEDIPVFDVVYDDLIAQPIQTVRRIYQHFGLAWSDDFELAMLAWLRENPQGKQGRDSYTLEEFGLTRESLEQRYEEYINMFLKAREPSTTDHNSTKNSSLVSEKVDVVSN